MKTGGQDPGTQPTIYTRLDIVLSKIHCKLILILHFILW